MRPHWLAATFLFATALATAQETPPTPAGGVAAAKPTDATAKRPSALELLRAADEAGRPAALAKFVDANIATNAVYAGQYAALTGLGWDTVPTLRKWLTEPPKDIVAQAAAFRDACLNALRDVVAKAPDDLIAELEKLATDPVTPENVATKAKYALAQFGKTEHTDAMITAATKNTTENSVNLRVRGWTELADIYYNLRKYEDAAKAHAAVISAIETVNPHFQGLPSSYYNCACALALTGKKDEAMKRLTKALQLGKQVGNQMRLELLQADMDIQSLRGEPEFAKLMKDYFGVEVPKPEPAKDAPEHKDGK